MRVTASTVRRIRQGWFSLLIAPPPRRSVRAGLTVAGAAAVVAIGELGRDTGINLAIAYALPPLVASVVVGIEAGLALSAEAAVVWAIIDPSRPLDGWSLVALDAVLRFLVVGLAVVLVWGLREALARARRSDERSRDFLGLAAHQLRTPLAGLSASAEALIGLGGSPAQEQLLANIAGEADRAGRLLTSLLMMSKLAANEPLPLVPTDMLISCQDATERVRSLAPHLEVSLSTSADTAVVLANPGACRHVLANLVENAMRHAHSSIAVELNRSDSRTVVTVRDDGPGLPSGSEDVAFEPFVSLDGAGGSGLGLPLARRLAQSLGGDLCYRDGAFVLELPSDPSAPPEPPARPSPPSGRAGRARSRRP